MTKSIYDDYPELPIPIIEKVKEEEEKRKLKDSELKKVLDRIQQEYDAAKIHPGEAIGIITAESFGEPGTQMSIHSDEKIIIKIKDRIRIMKIGEFVDTLMKTYGSLEIKDSSILPINDQDIYVPSLNKDEKIEWKKVVECSRHKTNKKLLKIFTRSGRSIISTDNHSFVVRKDNDIVPIFGSSLKIGDRVPVISYLPEHCIEEINLKDYVYEGSRFHILEENNQLIRQKTHSKPVPARLKLDKLFGWYIGAYLAEGNATHGQVSISNLDNSFAENIKMFAERLGLTCVENYHQRGFSLSRDITINSALFASFMNTACKTGSSNKIVPEFCYSAREEFVSGLLRGYFDGDGNFHVSRKMIRVSSNSEELCKGISLLLTRFKIFSHKFKDKKGQYWLLIPYKYAPLFLQHIGSNIAAKRKALELLAEDAKNFWNNASQDYTDMISGFGNIFYNIAKKLNYPTRYVNNFTKRQKIGRTALFRYIKLFEKLAKEKSINIKAELTILNKMFYSDVIWDEIINIKYVENNDFVYDLSVPGLETFTTFDGIITHNTLNVFHFAGVAEMSVTQGLPRLIEIFDARKEPSTPRITIYLTKENSKDPDKVKKTAAAIKQTLLGDIVSEFSIDLAKLRIEIKLNTKIMNDLKINESYLLKILPEQIKDVSIKSLKDNLLIITPKSEETGLNDIYKLKEKLKETYVKGVKDVSQVLPIKKDNEFVILSTGSNLKDVFAIEGVDASRTVTNNLFVIANVLGIEAARQAIINESKTVIEEQGLDIDIRHIMFLADVMTGTGEIRGITRSGITSEKESVLARASFETPIKHIVNASLIGEVDHLNSVIENVILNQPVPVGTGLPDLVARMKKKSEK